VIDYAFNELNLNRVEMRCGVKNKKSRKIPEKLGFREGVARQSGWLHDHFAGYVIYGMLANEWHKSKSDNFIYRAEGECLSFFV